MGPAPGSPNSSFRLFCLRRVRFLPGGKYHLCGKMGFIGLAGGGGGLGEKVVVDKRWVHPIGDIPLDEAALIEPLSVATTRWCAAARCGPGRTGGRVGPHRVAHRGRAQGHGGDHHRQRVVAGPQGQGRGERRCRPRAGSQPGGRAGPGPGNHRRPGPMSPSSARGSTWCWTPCLMRSGRRSSGQRLYLGRAGHRGHAENRAQGNRPPGHHRLRAGPRRSHRAGEEAERSTSSRSSPGVSRSTT